MSQGIIVRDHSQLFQPHSVRQNKT